MIQILKYFQSKHNRNIGANTLSKNKISYREKNIRKCLDGIIIITIFVA